MRRTDMLQMHRVLVKRRDALLRALTGDIDMLRKPHRLTVGDQADAVLDSAQDEIHSRLAEAESRELAEIEDALERIRQGTYGHCARCAGKISAARLKAIPYATLCIDCRRKSETAPSGQQQYRSPRFPALEINEEMPLGNPVSINSLQ